MIRFGLLFSLTVLNAPAGAAAQASDQGHLCRGDISTRFGYDADSDRLCRSEQDHVCRCRTGAYYDGSRDLCLDDWVHFQCLEKGGDWLCRAPGRCLCKNKPPRCKEEDLTPWKDKECGWGNCEDTKLLRGREPKPGIRCRGGKRWECAADARCPADGKKVCRDADFGPWRAVGCGVRGCAVGQMKMLRERKTRMECPESLWSQCRPDPACVR